MDVKTTELQVVSRPFAFDYSLFTSVTSAAIAMGAAAAVILFSSRSFVLTLFATVTVGYVLTSVTALLVAAGWTLGFLESILFAILIGISCDFVVRRSKLRLSIRGFEAIFTYYFLVDDQIHFSHAYASLQGHAPRNERTRFALISMGPSVLAAAFTTFAAALVMLGTVVTCKQFWNLVICCASPFCFNHFAFLLFFDHKSLKSLRSFCS